MLRRIMMALFLAGALAGPAAAQVTVAPTVLVLGERERIGTFVVNNQSGEAQEVTVDFRFGYSVSDSIGRRGMLYGDSIAGVERSAKEWIRAFPRRFTLAPGEQQLVRMVATPPAGLGEGMYWTRIVTTSSPQAAALDTVVGGGVRAQITFNLEQVTTLLYRHGTLTTGLEVGDASVAVDTAGVSIRIPVKRTGNSPWLGTFEMRVLDAAGRAVVADTAMDGVYVDMVRSYQVPHAQLPPGRYTVELTARAERADVPAGQLVRAEPVRKSTPIIVP